jgi:hypothetical protein
MFERNRARKGLFFGFPVVSGDLAEILAKTSNGFLSGQTKRHFRKKTTWHVMSLPSH